MRRSEGRTNIPETAGGTRTDRNSEEKDAGVRNPSKLGLPNAGQESAGHHKREGYWTAA